MSKTALLVSGGSAGLELYMTLPPPEEELSLEKQLESQTKLGSEAVGIERLLLCWQDPEHLFETISQAMLNAVDRDAVSGMGVIVHIM